MDVADFFYHLPQELIANAPQEKRDSSKLLVVNRDTGRMQHRHFSDLVNLLTTNDVLVLNQSKVFPARLLGNKTSGGKVEVLLIKQLTKDTWQAISRPGLSIDACILFPNNVKAQVIQKEQTSGELTLAFSYPHTSFFSALEDVGKTPIPGYIHTQLSEKELREKYQSVFAKEIGSAAAPTASLHFTKELLEKLRQKGVKIVYVTLHVGLGTFQSLRPENFATNSLHSEAYEVTKQTAEALNTAKKAGKRIIAVGTTALRTLETVGKTGEIMPGNGETTIFIYPPYKFAFTNALITNFHLPESSLLMLVSAFVSYPNTKHKFTSFQNSIIGKAYQGAILKQYRFFSFGDAMLLSS